MSGPDKSHALFDGGGQLGQMMARFDWSRTSLGPVADWPESLRTAVRIVLTSQQPMFVWWGPDLVNIYNDAYRSILGGKHPQALGRSARLVWQEIWDDVEPRVKQALDTNLGTYDEALLLIMERSGYPEETYYTFSYSPVPDGQGGSAGIFCANTDDTQRIIGVRQQGLLQELATNLADARTLEDAGRRAGDSVAGPDFPFAALYLQDPNGQEFVRVGEGGLLVEHPWFPPSITTTGRWPVSEALQVSQPILVELEPGHDFPSGPWPVAPHKAALVRVAPPGESGRPALLILGLNPYRLFDQTFSDFTSLLSTQIAAGFANAQAYEEERKRAEALAELDQAKTTFFSNISHEFRTPLTLMLGPTEEALAGDTQSLTGRELEAVHRNQLRLLKLVNALLDFSRIEAGRMEALFVPTPLDRLTSELASMFQSAVERAGLQFKLEVESLSQPVFVDRAMWEKVVLNLLSNALKFTFQGSVKVALAETTREICLTVSDTGGGIPPEHLPHLFKRFHRVEGARSRSHEGSGIGLALVQDLVKLHGGRIEVNSELGQGTTFAIFLPHGSGHLPPAQVRKENPPEEFHSIMVRAFVDEALGSLQAIEEPTSDVSEPGFPTVLLADDNADMRGYIKRILGKRMRVETVTNGREALEFLARQIPDLLLTDVMMPEMNGFELLAAVRAQRETRTLPVIMLSARAGEEARAEGLESGADDYLVKPFSSRELLARVEGNLALGRLRQTIATERSSYALVFQQAPLPIAVFRGDDLVFELANPAYLEGVGHREVIDRPLLEALPELRGQGFDDQLRQVLRTGVPYVDNESPVLLARGPQGELQRAFFSYIYAPLTGGEDNETRVVSLANEVTNQVLARENAARLAADAQAANRAKDEFLAMLGHELRNPLSPILTALELLRMKGQSGRELSILQRQVGHLVRLVDDLLDVSRIARGKVVLERQVTELATLVSTALETASPLFEERHQTVDVQVPSEGLTVKVDPGRLIQVISNLLTNAAKYSGSGSRVEVVAVREGDKVRLMVSDQGSGIEPEMLEQVFELFTQRRQTIDRSLGGLGLGLSIVKNITALHHGRVWAESEGLGKGSRFFLELPWVQGESKAPVEVSGKVPEGAPLYRRVLVVDDNPDAARTLALVLEAEGYSVKTAYDGPTALSLLERFKPEVAVLDIGLPVMNGYELAEKLQQAVPEVRLIAVTGYGQEDDRKKSREAGFTHHLVKPVSLEAVRAALESE